MDKKKENDVIDLSNVLENYDGKWVILSKDNKQVLKSGKTFDDIIEYVNLGIALLVPDSRYSYSPIIL